MGYFTFRLFQNISLEQLKTQAEANLALYKPSSQGAKIRLWAYQGDHCSGLMLSHMHEEQVFRPLGFQFDCIWMDVQYLDGDSWALTVTEGTEHRVSHDVNPWANERPFQYDERAIDFRINRVCELWPRQGEKLRPYMLLWGVPVPNLLRRRFKRREGKACPADKHGYGNADQIYDFLGCFGISNDSPKVQIQKPRK